MKAIEVIARFSNGGDITPLAYTRQGVTVRIEGLGRRWEDAAGLHFLVMVYGSKVAALHYRREEGIWYLEEPPSSRAAI